MTILAAIVVLALGTYAFRATGIVMPTTRIEPYAQPVTAAILAALIVTSTLSSDNQLVLDHRTVGLAAAIAAIVAKRELLTVVAIAVAATALSRFFI
ncbi:AzlD domain-containing protein [Ilumatobacter sp.]|uniref:AzlD domain-containing protein n=1 Tax=Ilumatobacter sp. TaxID=1967498 RepID=UPI003B5161AF